MEKTLKPASARIYFNDEIAVVAAKHGSCLAWCSVIAMPVADEELGSRILTAWDLREKGDPDAASLEDIERAELPLRRLFGESDTRRIKNVGVNRLKARAKLPAGRMNFVASELKGDDNRYRSERVELPPGAEVAAIGAAANEAMAMTLT